MSCSGWCVVVLDQQITVLVHAQCSPWLHSKELANCR